MTIQEIHVGIDLGIQRLNSNVFGNIQKPEKDYYINIVIDQLLRAVVLNEKNTVFSLLTYADIGEFYEAVQNHIVRTYLGNEDQFGEGFVRCKFPMITSSSTITSGNLINGVEYVISNPSDVDLSGFGGPSSATNAGEKFICVIPDIKPLPNVDFTIWDKAIYQTINPAGVNWTIYGAPDNEPNTIWTADITQVGNTSRDPHLKVIAQSPLWDTVLELTPLSTMNYYLYIRSDSLTRYGSKISSGKLYKGRKYVYIAQGTSDLTDFGGYIHGKIGTIFTCTYTGEPIWADGTMVQEIRPQPNRLLKEQDVRNALTNSFGTVITSPICTIRSFGLDVFYTPTFVIDQVQMSYIRQPIKVSYEDDITTDLPESIHGELVGLIVAYIAADLDPQTYPIKKDKAMQPEQTIQQ